MGIDLGDDYSQVSCWNPGTETAEALTVTEDESSCLISSVICKKKTEDVWYVGEEAYRRALLNEGVMVDKLIKLARRDGSATIEGVKYTASELLYRFVNELMKMTRERFGGDGVESLVFTVQSLEGSFADLLVEIAGRCGVPRGCVHIMTHAETFLFYVLSQQRDVWANACCMFDLTEEGLHYYEMRVIRGRRPQIAEAWHEKQEDGFDLSVLDTESGRHMGDLILVSCARRLLARKVFSSVFLTGRGFVTTDWAPDFLTYVCQKRKVFAGQHVFASGAACAAADQLRETSAYPFTFLCEGRIESTVSVNARWGGRSEKVVLAEAGTNWYEARSSVELIPDGTDTLEFQIQPASSPRTDKVRVNLDEFPRRPNKTTRIEVIVAFNAENSMTVRVRDLGFGELFMSSGKTIRKDFLLS